MFKFLKKAQEEKAAKAAKAAERARPKCPRCHVALNQHNITTDVESKTVEVDVCHPKGCGGVWLQEKDFKADTKKSLLLDEELLDLNLPHKLNVRYDTPARCPDCKVVMKRVKWRDTDIVIDKCEQCNGRWFDGGEIHPIYEILLRDRHNLHRKPRQQP